MLRQILTFLHTKFFMVLSVTDLGSDGSHGRPFEKKSLQQYFTVIVGYENECIVHIISESFD